MLNQQVQLTPDYESVYYSSWMISAIHICTAIPDLQTAESISKCLELPLSTVQNSLATLERIGFVQKSSKNKWQITKKSIHLPRRSPFERTHHLNWRLRGITKAQQNTENGVHYTSIYALASNDIIRIEEVIRECIEKSRKIMEPSLEEELVCFTCDFFRV